VPLQGSIRLRSRSVITRAKVEIEDVFQRTQKIIQTQLDKKEEEASLAAKVESGEIVVIGANGDRIRRSGY